MYQWNREERSELNDGVDRVGSCEVHATTPAALSGYISHFVYGWEAAHQCIHRASRYPWHFRHSEETEVMRGPVVMRRITRQHVNASTTTG
jgi:hypothetical protein